MLVITLERYGTELCKEFLLVFSLEENLIMAKNSQFLGGFAAGNASLVATEFGEEGFQGKVIGRQALDVVTMQEVSAIGMPGTKQGIVEGRLSRLTLAIRVKLGEHMPHCLGHRLAGQLL